MLRFGIVLVLGLAAALPAVTAAPRTVEIRDHLGVDWKDELVHYPVQCEPGRVKGIARARVKADGKPITCQVSDVVRHDDGSLRSCNVWFLATVPANGSVAYEIEPGKRGPHDALVDVRTTADSIEITTTAPNMAGIRLPGGGRKYDRPEPAAQAPAPIQGLLLPSGRWTGRGRIEAPFAAKSYQTEVTADGPLFAEARVSYRFETGYWNLKARVVAGSPMVIIEEEFDTGWNDQPCDKVDRFCTLSLTDGGFQPKQAFFGGRNDMDDLQGIVANGSKKEWLDLGKIQASWFGSPVHGFEIPFGKPRNLYNLTGYTAQTARIGCLARVLEPGGDAVGLAGLDTAAWRNMMSLRLETGRAGELVLRMPIQVYEQNWPIDGLSRHSPNYTGATRGVPETTARRSWGIMLSRAEDEKTALLESLFRRIARLDALPLDEVKDWTLDWPDPMADAQWAKQPTEKGTEVVQMLRDRLHVKRAIGHLGRFSMGYHYGYAKGHYPAIKAVIDSPAMLTAEQRKELRRLCAWLAYDMNSRDTFPWGTGAHLNNPNMSVMAMEARVKSSILIKDHPMFATWGAWTHEFLKDYVRRFTRDSGALYENPHYSLGVTLDWAAQVNNILMANGLGDAFDTDLFRRSMRFTLDWLTPPDPRFNGHRVVLPIGNCSYQSVPPTFANQFVKYYKDRDAELAGQLQWAANQTLPDGQKIRIVEDLVPQLGSVHYEDYGVYFRHGFGTPYETLFFMFAGNCDGHCEWEADQMGYTLYAKGQPINLHFGNGYFPMFCRPWLRNRVSFDMCYEPSERNETKTVAATFNPETEYMRAFRDADRLRPLNSEYPQLNEKRRWSAEESKNWRADAYEEDIPLVRWWRQVLFLKDQDPKGPNYFVLRDAFGGTPTKPTDLSLWFLANKMVRQGDVFHFDGQCLVDMDVFVNTPQEFEPHTDTYGHVQQPYRRLTGFDPRFFPGGKLREDQLLLRVRRPAGEGYMVVLYPRLKQDDPPAVFTRLAESVVKVETPLSTDYVFLSPSRFNYKDDKVRFDGMAASIRFYKGGKITVANSEGKLEVVVAGRTITGEGCFVATLEGGAASSKTFEKDARVTVK